MIAHSRKIWNLTRDYPTWIFRISWKYRLICVFNWMTVFVNWNNLTVLSVNKLNFVWSCGYIGVRYINIIITKFNRAIRCNYSTLRGEIATIIKHINFHCSIWRNLMIQHEIINCVSIKIVKNVFIILIITELRKCSLKITCRKIIRC